MLPQKLGGDLNTDIRSVDGRLTWKLRDPGAGAAVGCVGDLRPELELGSGHFPWWSAVVAYSDAAQSSGWV